MIKYQAGRVVHVLFISFRFRPISNSKLRTYFTICLILIFNLRINPYTKYLGYVKKSTYNFQF